MSSVSPGCSADSCSRDTALWLHNKLGSSDDTWCSPGITQLTQPGMLARVREVFDNLAPQVKYRILIAILFIPKRNIQELESQLLGIIDEAASDEDPWVAAIALAVKPYPSSGTVNRRLAHSIPCFQQTVDELRVALAECDPFSLLPLECSLLSRASLTHLVGPQLPPRKHFALKRKPKSAAVRAELLAKAQDALQGAKNKSHTSGPAVPVRRQTAPNKMGPMRPPSLPSKPNPAAILQPKPNQPAAANRPRDQLVSHAASRKERGAKLIEIEDQPVGRPKRPKQLHVKDEASPAKRLDSGEERLDDEDEPGGEPDSVPEYALGLQSMVAPSPAPSQNSTMGGYSLSTPGMQYVDYAPPTPSAPMTYHNYASSRATATLSPSKPTGLELASPASAGSRLNLSSTSGSGGSDSPASGGSGFFRSMTSSEKQHERQSQEERASAPVINIASQLEALANQLPTQQKSPVKPAAAPAASTPSTAGPSAIQQLLQNSSKLTAEDRLKIERFMKGERTSGGEPGEKDTSHVVLSEERNSVLMGGKPCTAVVSTLFQMDYVSRRWKVIKQTNYIGTHAAAAVN